MNERTVVRIQELDGNATFSLESPPTYKLASRPCPLLSKPDKPPFCDLLNAVTSANFVRAAGRKLFDDLIQHSAVGEAMTQALRQTFEGCSPIHVRMDDDVSVAADLPWEAICNSDGDFLALDNRWPVVRVRRATKTIDPPLQFDFEPPLRITVVLSAAGDTSATRVPSAPQWNAIWGAVQQGLARPNPLPIQLTVLVGEEALRDQIVALNQPWIKCDFIADSDTLLKTIRESQPKILHFFCHGTSEETPHLLIGTRLDWEAEQAGSIAITAEELRGQADPEKEIWLVTLNCCESATQARDGRRLATSLVEAGFPAALGMRESIDVQLAHSICDSFYPALLDLIDKAAAGGPNLDLEWGQALCQVRYKIAKDCAKGITAQQAARDCKTWTIPALYARIEPFILKRIAPHAEETPAPVLSEARKRQFDLILELQRQRTKAAEDYKDLAPEDLRDLLADFDAKLDEARRHLKEIK